MKSSSSISALLKKTFLDPVLEPAQSDPGIELRRCHMSSRANDNVVQQLKDSLDQIRLSCSWRSHEEKGLLFTDEIQNDLLNINLPLEEVGDLWEEVGTASFTMEDGLVMLYSGRLAPQCPKHLALSGSFLHTPVPRKERAPVNLFDRMLGFLGLLCCSLVFLSPLFLFRCSVFFRGCSFFFLTFSP